ncbi:hypothetical protein FHS31_001707 [Sphingomonas vulcanisoli]|uniref:Uncharacterized protein n=1 Tax=Sphingomonas vulcanisoli TaxID=1658060 RepID=A0ABX0TUM5_9SPHN|nr:hypothetical protein [Sphingomonas vulcanisoli]
MVEDFLLDASAGAPASFVLGAVPAIEELRR